MTLELIHPLKKLLQQLQHLLACLDDQAYSHPIEVLSHASIGQHTRHVIEFFTALEQGYETGHVNYDLRKRDKQIEIDRSHAATILSGIIKDLDKEDKPLSLVIDFNPSAEASYPIATNYARELVYNLEHIVHHMAIMRIGVQAISTLKLPEDFGIALSTLRHKKLTTLSVQ